MTCHDALEFLADHFDGSLTLQQRMPLHLHLTLCRHCRNYFDSYCKTIEESRQAYTDPSLNEELPEDVVQSILAMRK